MNATMIDLTSRISVKNDNGSISDVKILQGSILKNEITV